MREYIILVAVSAIVAAFADVLAPKEWRGYTRIIMGFLILSVLLTPLAKLKNVEIFKESEVAVMDDSDVKRQVAEELRKRVEEDIRRRISGEFGVLVEAETEILTDDEGRIEKVGNIVLVGRNIPLQAGERLKEVYGCDSVEFKFK